MKLNKNTLVKLIQEELNKIKELEEKKEMLEEEPIEHLVDSETDKQKEEDHGESGRSGTAPLNEEDEKEEEKELKEEKDEKVIEKKYKENPITKGYLKEAIEETIQDMIKNGRLQFTRGHQK